MSHKLFAVVAALGIGVAGFFMVRSLDSDLVYFLTAGEAVAERADFADGRPFKMSGLVVPGTITELGGGVSEFSVSDGAATVEVRLTRTPPPLFDEDVPVLLSGAWNGDVFVANEALIRHEEAYEAPSEGNYDGTYEGGYDDGTGYDADAAGGT
jgi:cytochrome c-type biogenesis protein CcmE